MITMKKYGDDADSFHDQGTRVEESKQWHEANQLRHDYSYHSLSKPKSTYKPKSTKNYAQPRKCINCGHTFDLKVSKHCPKCGTSNIIIKCRKCGKEYNKIQYDLCPYCNSSQSHDKTIFALCFALLIIFAIIMMLLL